MTNDKTYQALLAMDDMKYQNAYNLLTDTLNEVDQDDIYQKLIILDLRAACSIHLKNYKDALADSTTVLQTDETHVQGYYFQGKSLYYMREFEKACEIFTRGLSFDPTYSALKKLLDKCKTAMNKKTSDDMGGIWNTIVASNSDEIEYHTHLTESIFIIKIPIIGIEEEHVHVRMETDDVIKIMLLSEDKLYSLKVNTPFPINILCADIDIDDFEVVVKVFRLGFIRKSPDVQPQISESKLKIDSNWNICQKIKSWLLNTVQHEKIE
ncbi:hypothetical protein I4U23_010165 [Adineta vaga]|nr:hypothetical protein I4U23_010165 [Adineta vaga]